MGVRFGAAAGGATRGGRASTVTGAFGAGGTDGDLATATDATDAAGVGRTSTRSTGSTGETELSVRDTAAVDAVEAVETAATFCAGAGPVPLACRHAITAPCPEARPTRTSETRVSTLTRCPAHSGRPEASCAPGDGTEANGASEADRTKTSVGLVSSSPGKGAQTSTRGADDDGSRGLTRLAKHLACRASALVIFGAGAIFEVGRRNETVSREDRRRHPAHGWSTAGRRAAHPIAAMSALSSTALENPCRATSSMARPTERVVVTRPGASHRITGTTGARATYAAR